MKRQYKMPYEYFRCRTTRRLERTNKPWADPYRCFEELMWKAADGREYLLPIRRRKKMEEWKFPLDLHSFDELEDDFKGHDAFIFCPGTSLEDVDLSAFIGRLTIAVNSAQYRVYALFWVLFEAQYPRWMNLKKIKQPPPAEMILTARAYYHWRAGEHEAKNVWLPRFEERGNMPHRTPCSGVMGALVSAWWLGAKKAYLLGMDLHRPKGVPYVSGVPYSVAGTLSSHEQQRQSLCQFKLPDFEVINGSPHSTAFEELPFTPSDYSTIEAIARAARSITCVSLWSQ